MNLPGYTPPDLGPDLPGQRHEHAKADALRVMGQIQEASLAERLRDLYARAARREIRDQLGRRWRGMTDYEAAAYLGVERTSINAARNALVRDGAVGKLRRRPCRYRPSGQTVWAWALTAVIETRDA